MNSKDAFQNPMLENRPNPPEPKPVTVEDVWEGIALRNRAEIEPVFEALYEARAIGCFDHFNRFLKEYSLIFYGDKQLVLLYDRYVMARTMEERR